VKFVNERFVKVRIVKISTGLVEMSQCGNEPVVSLPIITFAAPGPASNGVEAGSGSGSEDDMTGLKWMLATAVLTTAISGSVFAQPQRGDNRRDDGNYVVQRYDRGDGHDSNRGQIYNRYVVREHDRDNRVVMQRDRDYRAYQRRDSDDWNRR
jgi:hypothetical protein